MTSDPGDQTYYTWDHRNRLIHVSGWINDHESLIVDYGYDAFNQLVYVHTDKPFEEGETSTVLAYDGGQAVLQFDEVGSDPMTGGDLSHRYLWGPAVDQLLADEQVWSLENTGENETLWALADGQGTVRDLVDNGGRLRIHRAFDSFGNIVDETHYNTDTEEVSGPAGQFGYLDEAFAFTGRWFDKNTNLQNNTNRWCDPGTGRWLSEDPIGFAAGDANLYRYVGNGPTNSVDPSGLWWMYPVGNAPAKPTKPGQVIILYGGGIGTWGYINSITNTLDNHGLNYTIYDMESIEGQTAFINDPVPSDAVGLVAAGHGAADVLAGTQPAGMADKFKEFKKLDFVVFRACHSQDFLNACNSSLLNKHRPQLGSHTFTISNYGYITSFNFGWDASYLDQFLSGQLTGNDDVINHNYFWDGIGELFIHEDKKQLKLR